MTWRRAALYWCCFLGLGMYYAAFERSPAPPAAAPAPRRAAFLTMREDQLRTFEARRGDEVVRCRRQDGRWQVVHPAGAKVPSDLIAGLISTVNDLPEAEVVADRPRNLAPFGLKAPTAQLILTPAAGAPVTVRLGSRNPAGTAVYAQRSTSPQVFLIGVNTRYYADLLFASVQSREQ